MGGRVCPIFFLKSFIRQHFLLANINESAVTTMKKLFKKKGQWDNTFSL